MDISKHELGALWGVALSAWASIVGCATPNVATHLGQTEQPRDVINYVLVIKNPPGGDTAHVWLRSTDFDWPTSYEARAGTQTESGTVLASRRPQRDCAQEQIDCFRRCWVEAPPNDFDTRSASITNTASKSAWKNSWIA